jgi:hypothetical protein
MPVSMRLTGYAESHAAGMLFLVIRDLGGHSRAGEALRLNA